MHRSPYARYHLFRNPFGELSSAERGQLAVVDVEPLVEWLEGPQRQTRRALQLLGPCGHGKSTHLWALHYAWASCAVQCHYVYFPEEGGQPPLPDGGPLLIDEAQRMGWWRLRQLRAQAGPLVLATHNDMTPKLLAAGFETRLVNLSGKIEAERLRELLNRRVLASVTPDHRGNWHPLCLSLDQVVALQERFGSNIRHIEHYLYVVFQRFAEKGEPWLPAN